MENLLLGLQELADPQVLLFILIGGVVGLLAGAIPGLNDTNILTLFLSFVCLSGPVSCGHSDDGGIHCLPDGGLHSRDSHQYPRHALHRGFHA